MEEIDVIPSQVVAFGFDPVLIGQTQTIAPDQEQLCIGYFESFKGFSDSASACRDGPICPPSIEGGSICYSVLTGMPIGKCAGAYISTIFCMNPVASSSSIDATGIRLCMRIHFITFTSFLLDFLAEVLFKELTCACSSFLSAICLASGSTSSSLIYLLCLLPFSDH